MVELLKIVAFIALVVISPILFCILLTDLIPKYRKWTRYTGKDCCPSPASLDGRHHFVTWVSGCEYCFRDCVHEMFKVIRAPRDSLYLSGEWRCTKCHLSVRGCHRFDSPGGECAFLKAPNLGKDVWECAGCDCRTWGCFSYDLPMKSHRGGKCTSPSVCSMCGVNLEPVGHDFNKSTQRCRSCYEQCNHSRITTHGGGTGDQGGGSTVNIVTDATWDQCDDCGASL